MTEGWWRVKGLSSRIAHVKTVIDRTDGLSIEFPDWRFNLRCSNTEPVLRLNVESRRDVDLMKRKTSELLKLIEAE